MQDIFRPRGAASARRAAAAEPRVDATLALRELALRFDDLSAEDREAAAPYFLRPTDGTDQFDEFAITLDYGVPEAPPVCNDFICVHYVDQDNPNQDAPPLEDVRDAAGNPGANGVPDYVEEVLRDVSDVREVYLGAGYRPLLPDQDFGGDERFDVYLVNLDGLAVGYCSSDQPESANTPDNDSRWSFCAIDNDFSVYDNPQGLRQATIAHEYFHAVQATYDAFDDAWFGEATASWAEDELYDSVNDNAFYLPRSPLTAPDIPLDTTINAADAEFQSFHYGTWIYFRFLTEKYGTEVGGVPRLMRDLLEAIEATDGTTNLYSYQGIELVLSELGTSAAEEFLAFSVANRRAREHYEEGRSLSYPNAPLAGRASLSSRGKRSADFEAVTDHLTSATYQFKPRKITRKKTTLRVDFDMAPLDHGSLAAITVVRGNGRVEVLDVVLDEDGDGTQVVPFSSGKVARVEVTLVNASSETTCNEAETTDFNFSCFGVPTYDDQVQRIDATVVR